MMQPLFLEVRSVYDLVWKRIMNIAPVHLMCLIIYVRIV